jgi:hypothetical protein
MKVISVIENEEIMRKRRKHLGLWNRAVRPPPETIVAPTKTDTFLDVSSFKLPVSAKRLYVDPE